ncbi:MAG TPA: DUF6153 family protein [Marisediminicola sp.]|jgi:hypothetical protein|nr:DUF6153 family protein [Marisediminicola sp.]
MRTTTARARPYGNGSLQRLIVATVAVAAILLGLLAMHAMGAESSDHPTPPHTAAASPVQAADAPTAVHTHGSQTAPGENAVTQVLSELDAGDCMVFGVLCALGILAVIFTAALLRGEPASTTVGRTLQVFLIAARGVSLPRPPSLLVLSISRT